MKNDFRKIYFTVLIILAAIASVGAIVFGVLFNADAVDADANQTASIFFNIAYYTAGLFLFASIFGIIGFALMYLVKAFMYDPKKAAGTLVGVFAVGLIFLISYIVSSSSDIPNELFIKTGTNPDSSKMIGAGLVMIYILFAGVFVSLVYSEVAKKLK